MSVCLFVIYIFIMRSYTRYTQTQANNDDDNNHKRKKKKRKRKIQATVPHKPLGLLST